MLKIGDFSRIACVSVRMLRHYDQIGLLKPAYVDGISGYRSYQIEQLESIQRITFLKDVGFSLKDIAALIEAEMSPTEMKRMLIERQSVLQQEVASAQLQLRAVEERLNYIEQRATLPQYDVTIKATDSYVVAAYVDIVPHLQQMPHYCAMMHRTLYRELKDCNVISVGREIVFYYTEEYVETDIEMAVSVIIDEREVDKLAEPLVVKRINEERYVASLIYNGAFSQMTEAIVELLKWTVIHGWELNGPLREVHVAERAQTSERTMIEFQIPVKRMKESE